MQARRYTCSDWGVELMRLNGFLPMELFGSDEAAATLSDEELLDALHTSPPYSSDTMRLRRGRSERCPESEVEAVLDDRYRLLQGWS